MARPVDNLSGESVFVRARRVAIGDVIAAHGGRLKPRGSRARGVCPLCDGGSTSKTEPFSVDLGKGLFHCFKCGRHGDVIAFEQAKGGHGSALAAAQALAGPDDAPRRSVPAVPVAKRAADPAAATIVGSQAVADWARATARIAASSPVEDWLWARGLDPLGVPGALGRLRWHAAMPVALWRVRRPDDATRPPDGVPRCGAMVAPLTFFGGGDGGGAAPDCPSPVRAGVHVTYLTPDGRAKARLPRADGSLHPARKMFGAAGGAGFALTPLEDEPGAGPLLVGEGIETVWAACQLFGRGGQRPCRGLAAMSLGNLQGGIATGDDGFRIDAPRGDLAKPALTIARPGEVIILVDADMAPLEMLVRDGRRGRARRRWVTAMERAELCGQLAAQAWGRAGATRVRIARPRLGQDFNDALVAAQAVAA